MVHEDARELVAHGAVHEGGDDAGIHAATERQDYAARADLRANVSNEFIDEAVHGPRGLEPADVEEERGKHLVAVRRVADFGVELRGEEAAARALHGGDGAGLGVRRHPEALGNARHGVAMAHPYRLLGGGVGEEHRGAVAHERRGAVLSLLGVSNLAAKLRRHDLLAIAESEDGDAQLKHPWIHARRILAVHARRSTRENHGRGSHGCQLVSCDVAGDDCRVNVQVAHAPGDELPVLSAEVEYGHELAGVLCCHGASLLTMEVGAMIQERCQTAACRLTS